MIARKLNRKMDRKVEEKNTARYKDVQNNIDQRQIEINYCQISRYKF